MTKSETETAGLWKLALKCPKMPGFCPVFGEFFSIPAGFGFDHGWARMATDGAHRGME
jgi:hypothetical protein